MDSATYRRPLQDTLSMLVIFDWSDEDLQDLLIWLGERNAATKLFTERGGDDFGEATATKEYGNMLKSPTPIIPDTFTTW